jgi:hypothetical protein
MEFLGVMGLFALDPEQQKRHSMELLQNAPMDMGLGIKREKPHHY